MSIKTVKIIFTVLNIQFFSQKYLFIKKKSEAIEFFLENICKTVRFILFNRLLGVK